MHGGANARPFITRINAYDMRVPAHRPGVVPQAAARRWWEKIFEVNRNFRNEGADSTHNPEFQQPRGVRRLRLLRDDAVLTRDIILEIATAVYGRPIAHRPLPDGGYEEVDLSPRWPSMTVHEAVSHARSARRSRSTPRGAVACHRGEA